MGRRDVCIIKESKRIDVRRIDIKNRGMPRGYLTRLSSWYSTNVSPVLGVLVSAALALGPAPVSLPKRYEDLEALVSNLAAQQRYEALAAAAERAFERRDLAAPQRRLMAFHAIRGLHGVYEDTGKAASLCRAQRLLRRVEREVGLDEDASTAARLQKANAKLLAASDGGEKQCVKKAAPAKPSPAVAARPSASPAQAPSQALAPSPTEAAAATPPAEQDDLVAVGSRPMGHVSKDISIMTPKESAVEGPSSAPAEGSTSTPPRHQGDSTVTARTRGGIALLSVSAAAGAALGASLHYRGQATDRIAALAAAAQARGESTPEEYAEAHRLNGNHQRLTVAAWATGAVAIVGLVTGITLLTVKPRRTTTAVAPWGGPTGAGFTLRGHF
jgi:hypothetical protein